MPVANQRKEEYVEKLFSSIASRYDLLNTILSFSLHRMWRRFAVEQCVLTAGDTVVDVGAGTLDFSIELARAVGDRGTVAAVDFCWPMLDVGLGKLRKGGIANVCAVQGNAERLEKTWAHSVILGHRAIFGIGIRTSVDSEPEHHVAAGERKRRADGRTLDARQRLRPLQN
jgi:demethylmenaquinone methyltransferase/2-methoxy-6-polyprenyl-1,4-benzoquinol methylase